MPESEEIRHLPEKDEELKYLGEEKCRSNDEADNASSTTCSTIKDSLLQKSEVLEQQKCSAKETENICCSLTFLALNNTLRCETFCKRSGTTSIGREYEDLTVANFILKLLGEKTIKNFFISSNDEQFGSFDDVVLEAGLNDCYAFQLKHVTNKTLTTASLEAKSGNFSIKKYFESFQKCKQTMLGYKLVLLTNANFSGGSDVQLKFGDVQVEMVKIELSPVLKTCNLTDYCYKFKLANSSPKTKDYEMFFKNFILCTNQTNLPNLKKNLQNELKKNFTIDDAVLDRYTNFIYQWSSQNYNVKYKLSKNIMQKVMALFMLNSFTWPISFVEDVTEETKLFQEVISKFNVTHFNINLANKVQEIWGNLKETLIVSDLKEINKFNQIYQISKSYITDVKTLTNEECSKLLWAMNKCPLIVTESSFTKAVIELFPEEKFVVLSETTKQKASVFTKLVNLKDYSELYKEVLKNFQCLLPGEKINLEKLIINDDNFLEVITTNDLLQMLEKPYVIVVEDEELPMPYIDRFLSQDVVNTEYFKNVDDKTFIVISNVTREHKHPHFQKPNFYFLETECSQEQFDEICNNNINNMDRFHHFRLDRNQIMWLKSKGDVSDLKKYVVTGHSTPESLYREKNFHLSNNIFLVSDEPGKGKSVLLKSFKNAIRSSDWTVLFTSNEISDICKNKCEIVDGFKNYLFNVKFKKYNTFDKTLLQFIYNQKMVFMWDGLDEITSDEFNKITDLISKLLKFTHFITARTHLTETLENKFCVLSRSTEQFNEEQQHYYITKRLQHIFDKDNLENIVLTIKQFFEFTKVREFLSIPIQIYMITELCLQDDQNYSNLLNTIFSLSDVFNYFVEEKLKLSYKTKSYRSENPSTFNQFKSLMIEKYEKAALIALFEPKILVELGVNSKELPQFEDGDAFGFIIKFDKNNQKIRFVHQSYAEYFAAIYFSKNYKNISSLKTILFDVKCTNIRLFFDLLLAKDSIPHIAVLNKNLESLQNCPDLNVTDGGGRNVLHLAASWDDIYPLLSVEKKEKCSRNKYIIYTNSLLTFDKYDKELLQYLLDTVDHTKTDRVFKMDPLSYAESSSCLYAFCAIVAKHNLDFTVRRKTEFVCNILYYCIQFRFDQVFNFLSDIKYIVTKNSDTLLHLAAANHFLTGFIKIINFKQYKNKINNRNRKGETVLLTLCKTSASEICMQQFVAFVNFLIKSGANINATGLFDETPIYVASQHGHYEIVDLLIKSGTNVNAADYFGETPIYVASKNGHYKIVDLLIRSGANINAARRDGSTAIHVASEKGHYKIVDLLIKSGANINVTDNDNTTPIYMACENGNYKIVDLLIKSGANINAADHFDETPIYVASQHGHYEIVDLLSKCGANIDAADRFNKTPIYVASQHGHYEIVDLLIKSVANIDAPDYFDETPIYVASKNGHCKVVDLLIKSGADKEVARKDGATPIYVASKNGHYKTLGLLIKSGADIKAARKDGATPIYVASKNGHYKVVDLLIKSGGDIKAAREDGTTPIYVASENGSYKIVDLLINFGANINAADYFDKTPIFVASENGYYKTVNILIMAGANINAADNENKTPIHIASKNGHYEIVGLLIKSGSYINAADNNNTTPFYVASENGHYKIVDFLIKSGANINAANYFNETPIYVASKNGHYKIVDLLIESRANINSADYFDKTPIYVASKNGHYKIVDLLIESGANINAADYFDEEPIYVASKNGHYEIVDLLIESGANINSVEYFDETPLFVASKNGHYKIVDLLIKSGANINVADNDNTTPIHVASQNGHYEIVDLLVEFGANVNAADFFGNTPIFGASENGHYKIVDLLIKSGANPKTANISGKTPFDVASAKRHYKIVDLLIKY